MPVSQYEKFAGQFNPVKFDAKEWVRLAKNAGMRYIVITSKHHDGFGMFRSDLTDWCIKSTPFQRDPLKELAEACRAEGLKMCFYHSIMDWHHPDWGTRRPWNDKATGTPDMDRYTAYMKGQLKELLTRYGPIGILWFDGEWESPWTHERGVDLYHYVRGLQPKIIVNNRVGKARAGMSGMDEGQERIGDYGTPEQEIPATGFGLGVDWESCMTMNNHWGYNKHDDNWKSGTTLVRNLIDCSSKGGNYLLNIGPTSEGVFPDTSIERLKQIGDWMKVNSQSIYGTTASPFKRLPWGRCTTKLASGGATLYLHIFTWPSDGTLLVAGLKNKAQKAYLLADSKKKALSIQSSEKGLSISLPATAPDAISSTVVLKIKGAPEVEEPGLCQAADGSLVLPASEARVHGTELKYESGARRDNLGFWLRDEDWADWEFTVTQPGKFEVSAETAAPEDAAFAVSIGQQQIQGRAPVTGDYGEFKATKLGVLEINSPGKVILAVHPVKEGWHPINLRCIRLAPAAR
ncbi:Alpha-L-fucosidase [Verrucomicrobia bacterium]|nr:Alpha-L-fucosidase [Verrucomicrobiota bacterium]